MVIIALAPVPGGGGVGEPRAMAKRARSMWTGNQAMFWLAIGLAVLFRLG